MVLIRQIWLKRVPRDPFRPNLFAFLFKIGQNRFQLSQNGFQRGPKGSKCGQKRVNLYQNALNWVPSGLKWHQHPLKWVKTSSIGVRRGPTWPKGVKMASKWPPIPQNDLSRSNLPKSSPERVHPALPDGWSWNWDPSAKGTPARFTISAQKGGVPYVHRVGGYPMVL